MNKIKKKRKNNLLFSVILTTYNSQIFIKSALKNLSNQSFKNFEVIIIDDGSSDNTLSIARKYKKKKKINLKILSLSHLGSPARSRNIGINKSKGKYLCFFDCDDLFYKMKLNTLYKLIKKNNSDVFYHNVYLNHKNKNLKLKIIDSKNSFKDLFFTGNKIILSSSCVKKLFLAKNKIKFNEKKIFVSVEDYDFWLHIARNNGKFFLIKKILGSNNLNANSISKNRTHHFLATFSVIKKYEKYFKNMKVKIILRKIRILISFLKISLLEKNYNFFLFIIKLPFKIRWYNQ
tara:strand:+ start:524 stop:1393 length:870 start_codon:yes stop_codon:yes gene_type:complete